jgi:hypothetical protein
VNALQRYHQKQRQANGQAAENLVELEMNRRGDLLVEKAEVPFRVDRRTGKMSARRKVSGDFRAVRPMLTMSGKLGVSVLVEVKHCAEQLSWSAFRPHQILALDEHMVSGGITEVAWIDRGVLRFIPWSRFREIRFGPNKSVVWEGSTIALHVPKRKGLAVR